MAVEESVLYPLPREKLLQAMDERPQLAFSFLKNRERHPAAKKRLSATHLDMTPETFSRTWAAGYIKTEARTIILKNLGALRKKAVRV